MGLALEYLSKTQQARSEPSRGRRNLIELTGLLKIYSKMAIKYYKRQVNKKPTDSRSVAYSDKQKQEAVAMYLMVGNMALVAATINIPVDRLRHWKQLDWWKEYEDEIRRSRNIEVSGKIQKVIDKTLKVLEDRVEYGDFLYDPKSGDFKRKPISAKVASEIMVKSLDREIVLQKLEEKPRMQEEAILDRLKSIESALIRASKVKKINIIDAEVIDDEGSSEPVLDAIGQGGSDSEHDRQGTSSSEGEQSPGQ